MNDFFAFLLSLLIQMLFFLIFLHRVYGWVQTNKTEILKGHSALISAIIHLRSGEIASGSSDRTIRVWNAITGKTVRVLTGHTAPITSLVALPGDKIASGSIDKSIRIWEEKLRGINKHEAFELSR